MSINMPRLQRRRTWTVSKYNPARNNMFPAGLSDLQVREIFSVVSQFFFTDFRNDFVKCFQ